MFKRSFFCFIILISFCFKSYGQNIYNQQQKKNEKIDFIISGGYVYTWYFDALEEPQTTSGFNAFALLKIPSGSATSFRLGLGYKVLSAGDELDYGDGWLWDETQDVDTKFSDLFIAIQLQIDLNKYIYGLAGLSLNNVKLEYNPKGQLQDWWEEDYKDKKSGTFLGFEAGFGANLSNRVSLETTLRLSDKDEMGFGLAFLLLNLNYKIPL